MRGAFLDAALAKERRLDRLVSSLQSAAVASADAAQLLPLAAHIFKMGVLLGDDSALVATMAATQHRPPPNCHCASVSHPRSTMRF